jgi:hypothetical protein
VVKNPQGFALGWSQFLGTLSQLSQAEKTYFGLGFLLQTPNNPKAFRKKEVFFKIKKSQNPQNRISEISGPTAGSVWANQAGPRQANGQLAKNSRNHFVGAAYRGRH